MNVVFRDLRADEIECRIQQIREGTGKNAGKIFASCLLYKDARCDQRILDECVQPMNWQRHHLRDNANCIVSIWDAEKQQWIEKEDTGTESNTEAEKGLASDSFKRACFNWGIGRELYTAPDIRIELGNGEYTGENGRYKSFAKFHVSRIVIENKTITGLELRDRYDRVRFTCGDLEKQPGENPEGTDTAICMRCGRELFEVKKRDGSTWSVEDMAVYSHLRFGKVMCADCMKISAKEENEADNRKPESGEQVRM